MTKPAPPKAAAQTGKADRRLDETLAESFPASDPPAQSGITGVGHLDGNAHPAEADRPASDKRGQTERPTGQPSSDRHAMETAHSWEDDDRSS